MDNTHSEHTKDPFGDARTSKRDRDVVSNSYQKEMGVLEEGHKRQYAFWLFVLTQRYNLWFYGLGSKRHEVLDFVSEMGLTSYFDVLVVDGLRETRAESIAYTISKEYYDQTTLEKSFASAHDQINMICGENPLRKGKVLLIIVFNFDYLINNGEHPERMRTLFEGILEKNTLRLIITSEKTCMEGTLSDSKINSANFIYWDITNFRNYLFEIETLGEKVNKISEPTRNPERTLAILNNLNVSSRKIYSIALNYQLKEETPMTFEEYYLSSKNEFLVNSEFYFRTILTEFFDHRILVSKDKKVSSNSSVSIPHTKEELKEIRACLRN